MITSPHNPKIQMVRLLQSRRRQRQEEGAFVVEGIRLAEEALASGWKASLVLFERSLERRGMQVVEGFSSRETPVEEVSPEVMRAVSDTQTPQGILVVLALRSLPVPEPLDFVFIPDEVRDPGNLGTMLRTAASVGVQAVFLPQGVVDAYAPKVVRAAMGAHFHLAIQACGWDEIEMRVEQAGLQVFLADAQGGMLYTQADLRQPLVLLVGGEAEGPSAPARKLAGKRLHIPMPGGMESLNAAVAAGVLLFEVLRQRAAGG